MKKILLLLVMLSFMPQVAHAGELIVKYKDGSYAVSDRYYDNDDIEYIQKNFSYSIC